MSLLICGMANETEIRPALTESEWRRQEVEFVEDGDPKGWIASEGMFPVDGGEAVFTTGTVYIGTYEGCVSTEHGIRCGAKERHALAALALYGQPFGFTQEDVTLLYGIAHHFQAFPGDRAYTNRITALADRIAAMLPPNDHA